MKTKALLLVSSLVALSGCSVQKVREGSIANLSHANAFEKLEVAATPEDQARDEVLAAPTEFVVPIEQDRFAWERARFFLENYGAGGTTPSNAVVKVVGSRRGLSSAPGPSPYTYEVFKDFATDGYRYSVRCVATDGHAGDAALNAGNFARFIRDGKLEVSLLVR
ncbi:MAG: hypothetical protein RL518_386 [Pseudomonadota bacterium]|jgi:hypothetical protein